MKILFVKDALAWPRSSGHDVHSFHMMQSLIKRGFDVSLLTSETCQTAAIDGLDLNSLQTFDQLPNLGATVKLPRLQEKFCSYWGTDKKRIANLAGLVNQQGYEAVIVVGLDVLPYLSLLPNNVRRIWYAADEWFLHHWSQVKFLKPATWPEMKLGIVKGLYEFAFSKCTDRVWVVSDKDATAVRWIMPRSRVDVIANGVDADHFDPSVLNLEPGQKDSEDLVFWGRLDFGPNLDAIEWFCETVWPQLRKLRSQTRWTVYGFKAGNKVRRLAEKYQFKLVPDLPDLRSEVLKHKVVVLPFVSGAGIKNKFLEAAALARPIVASKRALNGVDLHGSIQPCQVAGTASQWIDSIMALLEDSNQRSRLGQQARDWVVNNYSWDRAAALAREALES